MWCGVWFWCIARSVGIESADFYSEICESECVGVYFASGLEIGILSARDIGVAIGNHFCAFSSFYV